MELKYQITGKLGRVFFDTTRKGKVANFFILSGGHYSSEEKKWMAHTFPIEAWLEEQQDILRKSYKDDVLTVEYIALPREIKVDDKYKRTIIIWKAQKIHNWRLKGGNINNEKEPSFRQMDMDENLFKEE